MVENGPSKKAHSEVYEQWGYRTKSRCWPLRAPILGPGIAVGGVAHEELHARGVNNKGGVSTRLMAAHHPPDSTIAEVLNHTLMHLQ